MNREALSHYTFLLHPQFLHYPFGFKIINFTFGFYSVDIQRSNRRINHGVRSFYDNSSPPILVGKAITEFNHP